MNALKYGVNELAKEINDIIQNPRRYFDFFKWHKHYSFHSAGECSDCICGICAVLNARRITNKKSVYNYISKWWNEPKDYNFTNVISHWGPEPQQKYNTFLKFMTAILGFGVLSLISVAIFMI